MFAGEPSPQKGGQSKGVLMLFAGSGGRTKPETHMISAGMLERGGSSAREVSGGVWRRGMVLRSEREKSLSGNERKAN